MLAPLVKPLRISDVKLITPPKFTDERGFFSETWNAITMERLGIRELFVQDNHSLSHMAGTIRGLHFQTPPHAQGKLIRVVRGSIFDVAVDLRTNSPTRGKYVSVRLSAESWSQLWIPVGFAHGFCTLEPDTQIIYKVTDYYDPICDAGIVWNDPQIGVRWPVGQDQAVLSQKDRALPRYSPQAVYF